MRMSLADWAQEGVVEAGVVKGPAPSKGCRTVHIIGIVDGCLTGMWAQVTTETPEIQMVFYVESLGFKMFPIHLIFQTLYRPNQK